MGKILGSVENGGRSGDWNDTLDRKETGFTLEFLTIVGEGRFDDATGFSIVPWSNRIQNQIVGGQDNKVSLKISGSTVFEDAKYEQAAPGKNFSIGGIEDSVPVRSDDLRGMPKWF